MSLSTAPGTVGKLGHSLYVAPAGGEVDTWRSTQKFADSHELFGMDTAGSVPAVAKRPWPTRRVEGREPLVSENADSGPLTIPPA